MPPLTIASFAQALTAAPDIPEGLRALRAQLDEIARGTTPAFCRFDARRQLLTERFRFDGANVVCEEAELSPDHLPQKLRKDVLNGGQLVDFGERSTEFSKFLGIDDATDSFLLLQGVQFDGDLAGLIAIRELKQRFGSRAVERIAGPVAMFALAVTQLFEREARSEAERAVEDLVTRIHEEYGRSLSELRGQLTEALRKLALAGSDARVTELETAARAAAETAHEAVERLSAVEQQVTAAVGELEKAHLDLSRQSEQLRTQGNLLTRIQRQLSEAGADADPRKLLKELLATVSGR